MTETIESDTEVTQLLLQLSKDIQAHITRKRLSDPLMIGIHTGGLWVATRLHQLLPLREPLASLDISFYRDDFSRIGLHPKVNASEIPTSVEDRHIILVDDVLQTGRTIRAAMNEIFDYGRPASISLAVLAQRSGHELPIKADAVGVQLTLEEGQYVKLTDPENLTLQISTLVTDKKKS